MLAKLKDRIDRYQRAHAWAGFPLAVLKKFREDRAGQQAALIAYYGFFSLFPLLLLLVTLLGILLRNQPHLQDEILRSALSQFPIIGEQIRENLGEVSRSGAALGIGLFGALWAGLAGVKAMQNALDHVWDVPIRKQPRLMWQIARGGAMLIVLGAFALVATGLAGTSTEGEATPWAVRLLTFPLSILLNVVVFLLAFKILTAAPVSWRDVAPGAVVAGLAWAALQAVGNYYVANRLRHAGELYGFFGIVLGLLSWLYLTAQVTLLAAEMNVVRTKRLWPRSLGPDAETETDERTLEEHAKVEERTRRERVDVSFDRDDTSSPS